MRRVAVFCGAKDGPERVAKDAQRFMGLCHQRDWGLVYGGGRVGLMGVFADEMLRLGGEVIGVIPEHLMKWEVGHTGVKDLRVVTSMHERKQVMYEAADAFVVFPGGIGTLDEFFEILTWKQLGHHIKPIAIYNPGGYFDGLLTWFARAVQDGLYAEEQLQLFQVHHDLDRLMGFLLRETT
jgi:uncharacterized protein (TIGR00730 family)